MRREKRRGYNFFSHLGCLCAHLSYASRLSCWHLAPPRMLRYRRVPTLHLKYVHWAFEAKI
jgi:hypothetical protein